MTKIQKHTLLAFMQDRPGVLNKISMVLRRKMYNIDTLTVCAAKEDGISRMTITVAAESPAKVKHMISQLKKLPEVIEVKDMDHEHSFSRELAIIKCTLKPSKLEYLKDNYRIEILSEDEHDTVVQIAGTENKIDAFMGELGMESITGIARTGVTAMEDIN